VFRSLAIAVAFASTNGTPSGASDAARALVEEFGIGTYTASREDDNIYELQEGYIIRTRYCYVYAYIEDVVVTDYKIIFIESDDVCDIEDVYRR
jgi:hypothetical protein